MDDSKSFNTLRGFLDDNEPDEEPYLAYSAILRLMGVIPDLDLITRTLGLTPTQALYKGDRVRPRSAPLKHACWHYQPAVPESNHLSAHIDALWADISEHRDFNRSSLTSMSMYFSVIGPIAIRLDWRFPTNHSKCSPNLRYRFVSQS